MHANAQTYTVSDFSGLQTAITDNNSASGGAIITLGADITLTASLPDITQDLTIIGGNIGGNSFISGNISYQIFYIGNGANVTINNLTLMNGYAGSGGAVFVNSGSSFTAIGCVFSGNTANYYGGAVDVYGVSSFTAINCEFSNNAVVYGSGGAVFVSGSSSFTAIECEFSGNDAYYGGGGAVFVNNSSTLYRRNLTFSNNSSDITNYGTEKELFTLTVDVNSAGYGTASTAFTGTGTGTGKEFDFTEHSKGKFYTAGSEITLTATANSGYQFENWKFAGTSGVVSTTASFDFTITKDTTITANFAALPTAPSITSQNKKSVTNCKGGSFQVQASGTTPITYSITGAPAGVEIDGTTGKITIPKDVPIGEHTFTLTAGNGVGSDTQDFTLTVRKCVTHIKGDVIVNGGTLIIGK